MELPTQTRLSIDCQLVRLVDHLFIRFDTLAVCFSHHVTAPQVETVEVCVPYIPA